MFTVPEGNFFLKPTQRCFKVVMAQWPPSSHVWGELSSRFGRENDREKGSKKTGRNPVYCGFYLRPIYIKFIIINGELKNQTNMS